MSPTQYPSMSTSNDSNSNKTDSAGPTLSPTKELTKDDDLAQVKMWIFMCVILLIVLIMSVIVSLLCYCKRAQSDSYVKSPTDPFPDDASSSPELANKHSSLISKPSLLS